MDPLAPLSIPGGKIKNSTYSLGSRNLSSHYGMCAHTHEHMIQRSSALAVQMLLDDETIANTGLQRKSIDEEEEGEIVRDIPWICVKGRKRLFQRADVEYKEERRG